VNNEELVSELLTTVFLMTYIMMTDLNDADTAFVDTCGLFLVGTLFVALGFSVLVMLADIYKTLRQFVLNMINKCKVRKAKKEMQKAFATYMEETVRAPIVRKKSEYLEEIREEEEEEEEEEDGVVKDVSFETENEVTARVDIKPVIIALSNNSGFPKIEIEIENIESVKEENGVEDIECNDFIQLDE
jgi:hypothetical protein